MTLSRQERTRLIVWTAVVLVLLAGHDLTHALDDGLETSLGALAAIAVPQWLLLAAAVWTIARGDRTLAAGAALVVGATVVVGFAAVHVVPFSPVAYWDLHPSTLSWVLVFAPLIAGVVLTAIAWREWRARPLRPTAVNVPR
jgi:hypothetical protein